jgi:hypothetical protein
MSPSPGLQVLAPQLHTHVVWFLSCFVLLPVFRVFSFEDRDDHTLSQDTPILHGDVAPVTFEQQLAALRFGTPAVA